MMEKRWNKILIKKEKSIYSISDHGDVRNDKTEKILKPAVDRYGYQYVILVHKGKRYTRKPHILVAIAFIPNDDPDIKNTVNHKDDIKLNNFYKNLEWMSNIDNIKYSHLPGKRKYQKGEDHSQAKYNKDQIRKVCKMLEDGIKYDKIEEKTGVSVGMIKNINRGSNWTEVSKDYILRSRLKDDNGFDIVLIGGERLIELKRR